MLEFEATIPEDLRCYLPINNVFTDVLTKRFGELVNPGKSKNLSILDFNSSANNSNLNKVNICVQTFALTSLGVKCKKFLRSSQKLPGNVTRITVNL